MKNFTLSWRSLSVAVIMFFAFGLQAQIDCGINRSNITLQVNNTCSEVNIPQHPYITIDFGPGSGNLNGTAIIEVLPVFSGFLQLVEVLTEVEVNFGLATFQLNPSALLIPGSNTVQLLSVNFVDIGCLQNFEAGVPIVSNPYELGPNSTLSIADDPNRNIVPPCQGVPTGRLSLRVTPADQNFAQPNRFSVRILPDTLNTIINVTPPGTFPNTMMGSDYYIVETNQSLTIGDYTFLLFDNVTNCEVAYDVSLGDPNAQFMVVPSSTPVDCFGDSDGTITVDVAQADPNTNGVLSYVILNDNGGIVRTGSLTAPNNSGYTPRTESNLLAGTYTITLTAGNGGCTSTSTITVGSPEQIVTASPITADAICASAAGGTYTIDVEGLMGVTGQAIFDDVNYIIVNTASGCWDSQLLTEPIAANGNYSLSAPIADALGCFDPTQDFTVSLFLEVFQDGSGNCRQRFPFDLFVKATPPAPEVVAYTVDGADSLASRQCSGAPIELLITNYDESLDYTFARVGSFPEDVSGTGVFADSSFTYSGSPLTGTIINNLNNGTLITYEVVATNGADPVSCDSEVGTIAIRVRPAPFLTAFPAGTATDTLCSGRAYTSPNVRLNGSDGSTVVNQNMRWNYAWDVPAGLTYNGSLPLAAEGLVNNATTGSFAFANTSGSQQIATLTITPILPQSVVTLSGSTVQDTCFGEPYSIALTVEPRTDLEVQANGQLATGLNNGMPASITVCSNSEFTFETNLFGVDGARYKIARILTGAPNVSDGNLGQLPAETRNLDGDFSETLRNNGPVTETVTYQFRSYTYGPNGVDGGGDDCIGESLALVVEVLPEISNEDVVVVDRRTVNGNTLLGNQSICSFDDFGIELSSSLDMDEFRYSWTRTVSPAGSLIGLDAEVDSGLANCVVNLLEIEQELATGGNSPVTVTYTIVAITPGPDGFFGTEDDCTDGDVEVVSVVVEPTPTLSFDLNGALFTFSGDTAITICSGEDFLIDNLVIPQTPSTTDNFLKYVEFDFLGDASFLDVSAGDRGVYAVGNFQLGTTNVVNTSPDNAFQIAQLQFTPYFENQDNTTANFDECEGETITLTIIINPAVPDIVAQDETLCSGEELALPIIGGTGSGNDLLTILSGEEVFSAENTEFIVPVGANSITNIAFELNGANGGRSTGSNTNGGTGYHFEGLLNNAFANINVSPMASPSNGFPVQPGDTVRVVLGASGADGPNAGDGGDASSFIIYAGPNSLQPAGSIIYAFVAAGGGGGGANESGGTAFEVENSLGASTADGTRGASFGGFGGLGFTNGYTGGAGVSNGGGGGGGYSGGNGGGNLAAAGGEAGTSLNFGPTSADGRPKDGRDGTGGSASLSYTIVYDDVNFSLVSKTVDAGLVDLDPTNVIPGMTMGADSLLFGEAFSNPTNGPLTVSYELTTTTEAGCGDAGSFTYTLTIEPNATGRFVSGSTVVREEVANEAYAATICSGDSLSAFLTSDVVPSSGTNSNVYFFVENIDNPAGLTILGSDLERASASFAERMGAQPFGGNSGSAPFPIFFYEGGIQNFTGVPATVTYTIASRIFNPMEDDCVGTSFTLAVEVLPGFDPLAVNVPGAIDACSGTSLGDAGLDFDAIYDNAVNDPDVDMVRILDFSVDYRGGDPALFDTVSGPVFGAADSIMVSVADLEGYTFINEIGNRVDITLDVRLVSAEGCISEVITLDIDSRSVTIIDAPEDNIIRDTICSGGFAGYEVMAAANSAFAGSFTSSNNDVVFYYEADVPAGIDTLGGFMAGSYPVTDNNNDLIVDDQFQNRTGSALTVTYRVAATATNFGCASDTVTFALVVEPEPQTDVTLVSGDSTATFGLGNARLFLDPNPVFEICSGQPITTSLANTAAASSGDMLMARVTVTDAEGLTGLTTNAMDTAFFVIPASQLPDSLNFAADELINSSGSPLTFTVSYATFFANPDGPNCGGSGVTEFDVTILPARTARAVILDGNVNVSGDTLCSGALFDLRVRDDSNILGVAIDSFLVEVTANGLEPGTGTMTGSFVVDAGNSAPYAVRVNDFSFANLSAGVKTATYIVTPYSSGGCLGVSDTAVISFLPEIVLNADIPLICGVDGVPTAITAVDSNLQVISSVRGEYRWKYIGGTANGFSIEPAVGTGFFPVTNPGAQANLIMLDSQATVILTPGAGFLPGDVRFEVIYDNTDTGCGVVTDTVIIEFSTEANAGTLDPALDVLCDGVNFLLTSALVGESEGGVFTDANGDPVGSFNYTPMIGGSDPTPVAVEFTYTVGGGNSGCPVASTTFSVMVEPAPNAGTLNPLADNEACQAALAFNLFDLIDGAMPGGTFTQTAGVDFVAVAPDGVFNQNSISVGTYVFEYEVTSANGCGSDLLEGITVEVLGQLECSTVVPCDTINLLAGFNVISFDVLPGDMSIENIFADEIATDNLLSVFSVNPSTRSSEVYSYNPVFGTTINTIGSIQDGLGYIVEVDQATTIITCGVAADTSLRVELISSLNIVGYTKPEMQTARNYFSTIISNGDVNQIRTVTEAGVFQRLRFNPLNGSNIRMNNSRGYLLDMTADYAPGTWRDDVQAPTSNFDRLFGYTNIPEEFAGQYIRFVDAAGNVYGKVAVAADGTYDNMILFGDLAETDRLVEGPAAGEELFAEFRGETIATGMTFEGNWNLRQLDLNYAATTPLTSPLSGDFEMDVFPNPTIGLVMVNLSLDQDYETVHVEVYSTLGQLVVKREINGLQSGRHSVELNVEQLPAGTYHIRVLTEGGVKGHKQIIRR